MMYGPSNLEIVFRTDWNTIGFVEREVFRV
jgi:hypothetical protein